MVNFLFFLLACLGMCFIIVNGTIFNYAKLKLSNSGWDKTVQFLNCPQCMGFWTGVVMSFIFFPFNLITTFAAGCASSFVCLFGAVVWDYLTRE